MSRGRAGGVLDVLVNIAVLGFLAWSVARPDGPVRARFVAWRAERTLENAARREWNRLAAVHPADAETKAGSPAGSPSSSPDSSPSSSSSSSPGETPTVVAFTDFECPFCRVAHDTVRALRSTGVRVVYRHLPLTDIHPRAFAAAVAAECAGRSGHREAFEDHLYRTEPWRSATTLSDWEAVAREAGISPVESWLACLNEPGPRDAVEADAALARELGVTGTPTFLGRRGVRQGVSTVAELAALAGKPSR